jgi:hypothetical protein
VTGIFREAPSGENEIVSGSGENKTSLRVFFARICGHFTDYIARRKGGGGHLFPSWK